MKRIIPEIFVENCKEALEFYKEVFGGEINRLYSALSKNGSVQFELQKTFWGAYHAVVTDIYSNIWGLNYSAS